MGGQNNRGGGRIIPVGQTAMAKLEEQMHADVRERRELALLTASAAIFGPMFVALVASANERGEAVTPEEIAGMAGACVDYATLLCDEVKHT